MNISNENSVVDNGFAWPTHLAHSNKEIPTQNISYTYLKKLSETKISVHTRLKEPIFYPKKIFFKLT